MGLTNFEIILDRHFYHPGENLSGTLVVELKRPKRMRGIYLKYFGQGKVHWRERTGDDSRSYFNKENYLKIRQLTFGNGITECELSAGRHVFVFSHPIPINVPCSYKSACGSIEYFVKATIDRPWKFNHVISQPVTVMSVVDLNYHPDAAMPVMESNCKTFWGHLKPFFMSCHIPNRGFVPGQIIPIQVNMKNTAEIRVKNIVAKLKQTVKYHTRSKSSSRKTTIYKCEHPIQEDFKLKEIVLYIRVPPTTPSYLEYCNIIDIGYYMTVKAIVGGLHKNLKVSTMIIIGNMPLTDDRKVIIGIYLNFSGKATVSWIEGAGTSSKTYESVEKYLELQQVVFGNLTDECELHEGHYEFAFSCPIPTNSPCTYDGEHGRVKYSVKATVDRIWRFNNVVKMPITVQSLFDLNWYSMAAEPVSEEVVGNFWGNTKPLLMYFDIPMRGFVLGQTIPIKVCLDNQSKVEVKSIAASLEQRVLFHTETKSKQHKFSVTKSEVPVQEGCGRKEFLLSIEVLPTLPCSYLEFCSIIDIKYILNIKATVYGMHKDLKFITEILIGNVPLMPKLDDFEFRQSLMNLRSGHPQQCLKPKRIARQNFV